MINWILAGLILILIYLIIRYFIEEEDHMIETMEPLDRRWGHRNYWFRKFRE